jgi:hypothetical protein
MSTDYAEPDRPWLPSETLYCPVCNCEPVSDPRENVDGMRHQPCLVAMALVSVTFVGLDAGALAEPHRRYVCPRPTCAFAEVYPDASLATFAPPAEGSFDAPRDGHFDPPEEFRWPAA